MDDWKKNWEEMGKRMDENWRKLNGEDEQAKKEGKLVGRIIKHSYADGYAVYKIIKENKKSVRIRVCTGIGDDWTLPAWGEECSIPKATALSFLEWDDSLRELFSQK